LRPLQVCNYLHLCDIRLTRPTIRASTETRGSTSACVFSPLLIITGFISPQALRSCRSMKWQIPVLTERMKKLSSNAQSFPKDVFLLQPN